jgi:hypothetical protein
MPSITTRFARPVPQLVMRTVSYVAILAGVWVVAHLTGGAPAVFIYQGF